MNELASRRLVEFSGLLSATATTIAVVSLERMLGWNIAGLLIGGFLPVGAVIVGAIAASGYYVGSIYLQTRPTPFLRAHIVTVTLATFFAIHYLKYVLLEVDGRSISEQVSYLDYLRYALTTSHFSLLAAASAASIELGNFGYIVALLQVAGFSGGGLAIFEILERKPYCDSCSRFLGPASTYRRRWTSASEFQSFLEKIRSFSTVTDSYLALLKEKYRPGPLQSGTPSVKWCLYGCTSCGAEVLVETPQVFGTSDWGDLQGQERKLKVELGASMLTDIHAAREAVYDEPVSTSSS